jgi:hypothetical protein
LGFSPTGIAGIAGMTGILGILGILGRMNSAAIQTKPACAGFIGA